MEVPVVALVAKMTRWAVVGIQSHHMGLTGVLTNVATQLDIAEAPRPVVAA